MQANTSTLLRLNSRRALRNFALQTLRPCLTVRLQSSSSSRPATAPAPSNDFPDWSRRPPTADAPDLSHLPPIPRPFRPPTEPTNVKLARLIYTSRKRGILETDLILSTFAKEVLPTLSRTELDQYDWFLEENDWDIYYWVTRAEGRVVPDKVEKLQVFQRLVEHAKSRNGRILRMPDLS
ncbi:early meiotic induction protein 5, mitochondrial precursor [Phlyctochytrium arcticum]|nr:early meiotic induction protein 5, mitochondrial precursor [Phlyctochytrium arcticum]KAI9095238.1 early meiotic induction protein 5, mitochondrial precursor [Phlyctochytrium arcticum]